MTRRFVAFAVIALAVLGARSALAVPDDQGSPDTEHEPKPASRGTVSGRITDRSSGVPLADTAIDVVGTEIRTRTDSDGNYRLELAPGKHTLRIWAPGYQPMRAENVIIAAGGARKIDVELEPEAPNVVEEYVIEAAPDTASVDALALERKRSAAMGDSVGRTEMSKTPDRNAAQAAKRVVGVTLVGNRFIYVRGLGERYTNALLNGAPLPSPEPDRAAVPLDLFPTLALESLTVVKTFTPDSPADFAGGSVRVTTRRIPDKFLFQTSLSGGFNTQSTFRDRLDYRGSSTDWLGTDNGFRALSPDIPDYKLTRGGNKPDGTTVGDQELGAGGRSINSYFSTRRSFTPPDHALSVVAGDGFDLGADRKLGVLLGLGYGRKFEIRSGEEANEYSYDSDRKKLIVDRKYELESGVENVSWGAFGSLGYDASKHHHLTLLGLHSQLADDTTQIVRGFNSVRNGDIHDTRLTYVSRSLNFGQLRGEHAFPEAGNGELDWAGWLSNASRNQPDTRNIAWQRSQDAPTWTFLDDAYSGRHFWSSQSERIVGGQLNWTQPLAGGGSRLKLGAFVNQRTRAFGSRAMRFKRASGVPISEYDKYRCPSEDFDACADSLISGPNIGSLVELDETTKETDAYAAVLDVYAAYLMTDVELFPWLRAIVGERLEVTRQTIDPNDQLGTGARVEGADIQSTDLLPALGLVFDVTSRSKLRASLSRTLARPQLRELAPFAYSNYFGGRFESGNKDLTLTHITNADLRFEYFPTLEEVLAVSVFYKHFTDPIETVILASGNAGLVTYQNAEGAELEGIELEARKSLGFLSAELEHFTAIANFTASVSRIELSGQARNYLTSQTRPMVNQAPYVLNLAMDYEAPTGTSFRVLYNVSGARIVQLGTQGLPDAYEQPRHVIDLTAAQEITKNFQLRATATDVLNAERVVTQGREQRDDNIVSRSRSGSVYSLTATYTH